MRLNDDLTKRALMHGAAMPWVPSPAAGVERRMLYRIGEEKARATSIVRYAAGSRFPRHEHPGGEEFLVLAGVFEDERGHYPAGSYVRNPPGSHHAPASMEGCVIFVRLWQFRLDDDLELALPPQRASGVLFDSPYEQVRLETWEPGAMREIANARGLELLVVEGSCTEGEDRLQAWSWLRLPPGAALRAEAGAAGARVWLKDGALDQNGTLP